MTLEQRIIRDLKAGQATLENLAENVGSSLTAVTTTLRRMMTEGKVWTMENKDGATVYKLTYTAKEAI
jgi:DNA-binding transcriptional regulator PaaX